MVDFLRDTGKATTQRADEHQVVQSPAPGTTKGSAAMGRYNSSPNPLTQAAYDGKPHVTTNREILQINENMFQAQAEHLPALALTSSMPAHVAVRILIEFAGETAVPWIGRVMHFMRGVATGEEVAMAEQGVEAAFTDFAAVFRDQPKLVSGFRVLCDIVKRELKLAGAAGKTSAEIAEDIAKYGPRSQRIP